jgi:hypothetical protein
MLQMRDQVAKIVSLPLRHLCPAGYNEHGNVNPSFFPYARTFLFYTFSEFMNIFIGLPNIFGGVTVEGHPASE